MRTTVADHLVDRLHQWGIHRIYGYPGDGINGIVGALDRASERFDFIQVRHEEMAAFMACGHAKFTGEVGVCLATSGPGAIHLLNGLYDAKLDHVPVVAIVGQQKRMSLGSSYQQEVDLQTVFKDVSEFVQVCMEPAQARHLIDRALRVALARKGVATVVIPNDVQEEKAVPSPPREHGAGVAKALLGRAALPDDLPFVTGPIGLLGSKPSYDMMEGSDTLLMIGSSFPYSEFLPKEGQARGVQIDIDPTMIGLRYPMDVLLVGDAKETLKALIPLLERKEDRSSRNEIEEGIQHWWRLMEERAMMDADPINPQRVVHELSQQLPD